MQKIKNIFIRINLNEEIEFIYERLDILLQEVEEYDIDKIPTSASSEINACRNALRRLNKIKLKYS